MSRFYLFLTICLFACTGLQAQSVEVPPNLDNEEGLMFTYIDRYIDGDTTASGEQAHDTYLLEAGGLYFFSKRNLWDFDLHFGAYGDVATLGRPLLDRRNPAGGSNKQDVYRGPASISFDNLIIIMGDEGPDANNYEISLLRPSGDGQRYIFNNCILEKARQAIVRSEGIDETVVVTNCHVYNLGDYGRFQGNGRLVTPRVGPADSMVFRGNVIHNILDRLYIGFRQTSLNYFEFSGNTVFNHVGRHGFIQLKNTKESIIYNNFIQNPSIIGSSPGIADEQINAQFEQNYVFTLDTIVEGGSVTMSNNNIHYTQDVLDHYAALSDSITQPNLYSPTFVQALTGDPADAHFEEVLELNAVPERGPVIQYAREAILFQDSIGITNMMVEDESFMGTEYDRGYLFDFINGFDPCYDSSSASATGGINGGAVGAVNFCNDLINSTPALAFNTQLNLTAFPNPASNELTLTYETTKVGSVSLKVFNSTGKLVRNFLDTTKPPGEHRVRYDNLNDLPSGMYIANIRTPEGRMYVKFMKQ